MPDWLNTMRRLDGAGIERSWHCSCAPGSKMHENMVRGALRNTDRENYVLDDGVPVPDEAQAE